MSREWKPGDVAHVNGSVAVRTDDNLSWWTTLGRLSDHNVAHARRLVVLDLNGQSYRRVVEVLREKGLDLIADMIAEQTTPPKPDEPQGLGAVVEDAEGRRYTRYESADPQPWWWDGEGIDAPVVRRYNYADFDAVRVLSEGVIA